MSTTSRHVAGMLSVDVKRHTGHQACPACGRLQCLCRPRFFAGQLLTEEDLNRLERYIVEKNKLHNRYLHGWGAACGLEVVCHECQGYVTVRAGYALSPCGDDIVVCQDAAVNVCDLIKRCTERPEPDCDPAWPRPDPICGDEDEEWILYICYDEQPSRGVTALRGASGGSCCSRCGASASSGSTRCGCGCQPSTVGKSSCATVQTPRSTPQQCEPTLTCEGYTWQLRKAPKTGRRDPVELVRRLRDCLLELVRLEDELVELALRGQLKAFQDEVLEFMEHHSVHNCVLIQSLKNLKLQPNPNDPAGAQLRAAIRAFLVELFRDCACSALLPPCPEEVEENCVPLATLTINCRVKPCQIVSICNWKHRRLVVTFPNLEYWLGFMFRQSGLSDIFVELCCGPIREVRRDAILPLQQASIWDAMFEEAVKAQGKINSKSIYQKLGAVWKLFASKLAGK